MSMANRRVKRSRGYSFHGIFAFSTTDTTKDVAIPLRKVEAVVVTPIGAFAAPDQLSVNETVTGDAGTDQAAINGSNGVTTVTVTRDAAGTSGLKFSLIAYGY